MDKHLHIVSFDVPLPADYGGVVDVFYKIKWLHQQGVIIHLHCFTKGRKPNNQLLEYCMSVNYYERNTNVKGLSLKHPYIVSSRKSAALENNLQKDNYPILLEGMHCTSILTTDKFNDRKIFLRLHNVEYNYYKKLATNEENVLKKLYFLCESFMLKKYEKKTAQKAMLLPMSKTDAVFFGHEFKVQHIKIIPAFTNWETVKSREGLGAYCLYHGNLSVSENEVAALWLIKNVFNKLSIKLVVAGKSPSSKLLSAARKNIAVIANPSENDLQQLIEAAQINILPSFNNTGIKLKLLNALFNGRHCIVNAAAAEGSGLESLCIIAKNDIETIAAIQKLMPIPFTNDQVEERKISLAKKYNNGSNAAQLNALIP